MMQILVINKSNLFPLNKSKKQTQTFSFMNCIIVRTWTIMSFEFLFEKMSFMFAYIPYNVDVEKELNTVNKLQVVVIRLTRNIDDIPIMVVKAKASVFGSK